MEGFTKNFDPRHSFLILEPPCRGVHLSHANRLLDDQSKFIQPLLPNYGVGRLRRYNIDINMMTILNSEERRLEEFIRLCDEVLSFEIGEDLKHSLMKGASISSSPCSSNVLSPKTKFRR